MESWSEDLVRDGMVVVEDALEQGFCEEVVGRRLVAMGVDESDSHTWPSGWHNLPATTTFPLAVAAPAAARAVHALVGAPATIRFGDLPDNLIVNFPDPTATWWPPERWDAAGAGWHKDGDWFRHFLDSPEQALLVVVFWRDVVERQGPTYVAVDSVGPVARLLTAHPEGLDPTDMAAQARALLPRCRDFRALTGRQGTIVLAHPFLVHTASVNVLDRPRIISNSSVMLHSPLRFDRPGGDHTAIERSILHHLGVDRLDYRSTGPRRRITPDRERRWTEHADTTAQSPG
jgi:hypothetical protein